MWSTTNVKNEKENVFIDELRKVDSDVVREMVKIKISFINLQLRLSTLTIREMVKIKVFFINLQSRLSTLTIGVFCYNGEMYN